MRHQKWIIVCIVVYALPGLPCVVASQDIVRVRAEILKPLISIGEPVSIRIVVTNDSGREIKHTLFEDLRSNIDVGTVSVALRRDGGDWVAAGKLFFVDGEASEKLLMLRNSIIIEGMVATEMAVVHSPVDGGTIVANVSRDVGAIDVKVYVAEYAIDQDKVVCADRPSNYESNIVTVDVTKPESPEAISASLVFLTGKIAESFDLGGISEDQLAKLEEVALSETDYAPYAGYLLAKRWRVQWQRERSKDRSISRISTDEQRWLKIADDDRFPLRSAVLMREQKIADRLGRKEEAEDIKREIVNLYPSSAAAQEIIQFHLVENID